MKATQDRTHQEGKPISKAHERRLQFIDFRLRWQGQLNRTDLMEHFGISTPQASIDLALYLSLAPENLEYDKTLRAYVATEHFQPLFGRTSARRYLAELFALKGGILEPSASFIGRSPACEVAPSPARVLDDDTLAQINRAILEGKSAHVVYQSMSSIEPSERWITPHALAYDGFRWHVRAFCHKREEYTDFVLARILDLIGTGVKPVAKTDHRWETVVDLVLAPHPDLSPGARKVIELDYGMTDGVLTLPCRQALLYYTLKRHGLLVSDLVDCREFQIILKNRTEVQPFIDAVLSRSRTS
jgi:hypothetical protein